VKIVVTGAGGGLGRAFLAAAGSHHDVIALTHADLDIGDHHAVLGGVPPLGADLIVNCAAFTQVDANETDRARAFRDNAQGPQSLALAARMCGATLLHVSTDYVFDGVAPRDASGRARPYVESDPTGPRSVYGATKLEGEREVLAASPSHTVVRTAWLYGVDGRNFVETMLRLAGERDSVQVVTDQVGSPTWGGHLAPALLGLLERSVSGVVHVTGGGEVSWNGFAQEIFRQAEVACRVEPASSEQMARPAPRPAWSALASERDDVVPMPPWQDGLAGYLAMRAGMIRA